MHIALLNFIPVVHVTNDKDVNKSALGRVALEFVFLPSIILEIADHSTWKICE